MARGLVIFFGAMLGALLGFAGAIAYNTSASASGHGLLSFGYTGGIAFLAAFAGGVVAELCSGPPR